MDNYRMGRISLALGILAIGGLAFTLAPIIGVVSIVLGIFQLKRTPEYKTVPIVGIVLSIVAIVASVYVLNAFNANVIPATEQDLIEFYKFLQNYTG